MNEIPYKLYKVADITQVADSEKVAGAIFFDDATETTHIYGADGTPVIYGSQKWVWSSVDYNTFAEKVGVGDSVLWSATELTIVARKDTTTANIVKVTLISDRGFNTLTFRKAATATEWSFVSSVVEDFDDFVKTADIPTPDWCATSGPQFIQNRTHYYLVIKDYGHKDVSHTTTGTVLASGLTEGNILLISRINPEEDKREYKITYGYINLPLSGPSVSARFEFAEDGSMSLVQRQDSYHINNSIHIEEAVIGRKLSDDFIPETIARTNNLKTINGETLIGKGDLTVGQISKDSLFKMRPVIEMVRPDPRNYNFDDGEIQPSPNDTDIIKLYHPYYEKYGESEDCFFAVMHYKRISRKHQLIIGYDNTAVYYRPINKWNFFKGGSGLVDTTQILQMPSTETKYRFIQKIVSRGVMRVGTAEDVFFLEYYILDAVGDADNAVDICDTSHSGLLQGTIDVSSIKNIGFLIDGRPRTSKLFGIALVKKNPEWVYDDLVSERTYWCNGVYKWIISDIAPFRLVAAKQFLSPDYKIGDLLVGMKV